jgi:hypothetical protein
MLSFTKAAVIVATVALSGMGASRANDTAATSRRAPGRTAGVITPVIIHPAMPTPLATPSQGGMQRGIIHDPSLDMDAFTVPYPAKWHFQGTMVPGTGCSEIPMPVYRVFSPDGLTEIERLPRFDWRWNNIPNAPKTPDGCLPFKTELSATDLLKYLSAMLKVEYVSEQPVAPAKIEKYNQALAATAQQQGGPGMKRFPDTGELASALVRYKNGSFVMNGLLYAQVRCMHTQMGPQNKLWDMHTCWANVKYTRTPEAQFKAVTSQVTDAVNEVINPQWLQAYMQRQQQQGQQMLTDQMRRNNATMQNQYKQFQLGQAARQRMNDDFNATIQRGTQMSMNQATQIANSDHTISSDYVDYSLDQQTVRDPVTGQTSKVSSTSSYTWLDGSGKVAYQTNDANADPNGTLKGTWTRQQKVHGDGSD